MMRLFFHRLLLAAFLVATALSASGEEIRPELALNRDPVLELPSPAPVDTKRLTALWIVALKRPEADMQRLAAEAIVKAHKAGIPGLDDARPELVRIVTAEKTHLASRYAAALALITLDHKEASDDLRQAAARHGALLRQLIEPALAKWDDKPIREVWLARLKDERVHRRDLMLALSGLGTVREARAAPLCLALAKDVHQSADVRLAAARAAGSIADSGWEADAERLASDSNGPLLGRLCAVSLLVRHRSTQTQTLLIRLVKDPEPSVVAAALAQLHAIDVELVLPLAEGAMKHGDANVRTLGARAYVLRPTPERVTALAALLDDPHPKLRAQVREDLFRLAESPALDQTVRDGAMQSLAGESWRGQEQAALLLAALDHKSAAPRMVELLESQRPEVMIATSWGLRKLAVPQTLPAMLDKAIRQTEYRKSNADLPGLDAQVAHLCEALGLMKYEPADGLLRQYVPKRQGWTLSRMAGIWAVGHLHAGKPDEDLAFQLTARLTDTDPINPEMPTNRMAAAIALGRMKAMSQIDAMRGWMGGEVDPNIVDMAIRWALMEMTGETLPLPKPPPGTLGIWFLEPLEPPASPSPAP